MKFFAPLAVAAAGVSTVAAQAANMSICDKYTTALLMNNTAANQKTVLTLVVNTALIGNYTNPAGPAKNAVTGILTDSGMYNDTSVNLLKYFDGSLMSTNVNGKAASVSFLDGGGATPLMNNTAANDTTSNQYMLVTHLYQLFGSLLGCSMQNSTSVFKNYQGNPSMSYVHKFMNLDPIEMGYFIQEVGLSATSFGVSMEDATAVGSALTSLFDYRCSPPTALVPSASMNASQSICLASNCTVQPGVDASTACASTSMSSPNGTNGDDPAMSTGTPSTGASSGSSGSGSSGSGDGASALVINAVGALALAAAGFVAVGL